MAEEGPNPNAWLVTFGDLITLMLTFFVLLLSMSSMDEQRIERSFSYFSGKPFLLRGGESSTVGPVEEGKENPVGQMRRALEMVKAIRDVLGAHFEGTVTPSEKVLDTKGEVRIMSDKRGRVIVFSGSFLFHPGGAQIKVPARPVLDTLAKALRKGEGMVSVEGHTDNREFPLRSRYKDRWDLSAARAVNVLKYLVQEGKIHPRRLSAVGYGDSRPVVKGDTPKSRKVNRRVEIVVTASQAAPKP
ncbi:MAG: flagellar motor protein MotB [bacterium]